MNERSQEQEGMYYPYEGGLTQIEPPDLDRTGKAQHNTVIKALNKSDSCKKDLETR